MFILLNLINKCMVKQLGKFMGKQLGKFIFQTERSLHILSTEIIKTFSDGSDWHKIYE